METLGTLFTGMSMTISIWGVVWLIVMGWQEVRGVGAGILSKGVDRYKKV